MPVGFSPYHSSAYASASSSAYPQEQSAASSAGPSSHKSGSKFDSSTLRTARHVYAHSVLRHGTSKLSKIDLRKHGFNVKRKISGATKGLDYTRPADEALTATAKKYNYLTMGRNAAKMFARYASSNNPAVVRTIGVGSNMHLMLDEDTRTPDGSVNPQNFRTAEKIKSKYVLGSKSSKPGRDESSLFRDELAARANLKVDRTTAGELLREVQSDSEDDFA